MKKLYLIIAILLVSGVSRAQTLCDSCCAESFPYTFCGLTAGEFVQCSSNPNAELDGVPVKSFIPSCVTVDPMPANVIWQPIGPPPAPETLLSNSALGSDTNKEAGAATQFDADQTSFFLIPPQAPTPPVEPSEPEDTCGEDTYPGPFDLPDRGAILERYLEAARSGDPIEVDNEYPIPPSRVPWNDNPDNQERWNNDESQYDAALAQFCLDTSNFLNDLPPDNIGDSDGYSDNAIDLAGSYYEVDEGWLNVEYNTELDTVEKHETDHINWDSCQARHSRDSVAYPAKYAQYEGAEQQYLADSAAYVTNVNAYVQVFNQDTAQSDAQKALNDWLNLCTPPIMQCPVCPTCTPCCIHVVMDDNPDHFVGTTAGVPNVTGILAQTLTPGSKNVVPCKDSLCPSRIIEVNVTDAFLASNSAPGSDTGGSTSLYTLHQVSRTEFFTGQTPPYSVPMGYSAYSFYQLMEHEIGHFLGLDHPDDTTDGGHKCRNCYTVNPYINSVTGQPNMSGFRTVMALNNNVANPGHNAPIQLSSEDSCQFEKLYCNACGGGSGTAPCAYDNGVAIPEQDEFKAELYPNPTTGGCTLAYEVTDQSFVQIAVYDMVGNQVRTVSSDYEWQGQHSVSLGTESLPSGNYVCRVRVGDRVSYINLAIVK